MYIVLDTGAPSSISIPLLSLVMNPAQVHAVDEASSSQRVMVPELSLGNDTPVRLLGGGMLGVVYKRHTDRGECSADESIGNSLGVDDVRLLDGGMLGGGLHAAGRQRWVLLGVHSTK